MTNDVLRVTHAVKHFADTRALDDVSLWLRSAEWLGLLGPNGAGKTTLLRAICGQIRLTGGAIDLFGVAQPRSGDVSPEARNLGIVPQSVALFPLLTARENLEIFGGMYGMRGPQREERISWALDWTGLRDRADEQVRGFSGGMMRRLNIACGVLHGPGVLLLDEPTLGVDPQSRQRIFDMLHELHSAGVALIHATNQIEDAEQFCDRIVILDRGAVIAEGSLDDLVARTLGSAHRIVVTLNRPLPASRVPDGFSAGGSRLSGSLVDIDAELHGLLGKLRDAEAKVVDVYIEAPRLRAVFLQLTGRELRD